MVAEGIAGGSPWVSLNFFQSIADNVSSMPVKGQEASETSSMNFYV
jgi:hypothetical protein